MDMTEFNKRFEELTRWTDLLTLPVLPPWPAEEEQAYECLALWFRRHADRPEQACPLNKEEGGYHWIHGGPYTAAELLATVWGTVFTADFLARVGARIAEATGLDVWSGEAHLLTQLDWMRSQGYDVDALFAPRDDDGRQSE
jgi:hypothetical protein